MKALAETSSFNKFKLAPDPSCLNLILSKRRKIWFLIVDIPINNGHKNVYCGCFCFYDKYICKHVVVLTVHLNLIVKGVSEDRNLVENFTVRSKPGKKKKSSVASALINDAIQVSNPKLNYKPKKTIKKCKS